MTQTGTELTTPNGINEISYADMTDEEFEEASTEKSAKSEGLARLAVQHQPEDDEGNAVPWGHWTVFDAKQNKAVYGKSATFRPLVRMYQYSYWDNAEERFDCSVQRATINSDYPDTRGTFKLGKLTAKQRAEMDPDSPEMAIQNATKFVQVLYGTVTIKGVDAQGEPAEAVDVPCVWNAKGGNYMPVANFHKALEKQDKPIHTVAMKLDTVKQKRGKNTYFEVVVSGGGEPELTEEDIVLRKKFRQSVDALNTWVISKHRTNAVRDITPEDLDLADQLEDMNNG